MSHFRESRRRSYDPPPRRKSWWFPALSLLNLVAVGAIAAVLHNWSEDWWPSMILVYLPKAPIAIPAGLLCLASLALRPKWLVVNLASLLVVLGPIMGFVTPVSRWLEADPTPRGEVLRVASCNIQAFEPDFSVVIGELSRFRPELVAFQEVRGEDHPLLAKYFEDWHVAREDGYWIGSKYPLRLIRILSAPSFERASGLLVEVDLPGGPVRVADIHLMTARRSLGELSLRRLMSGEGPEIIEPHQIRREQEMMEIRAQIEDDRDGRPLIALGDFNTPTSSSMFRRWWGDFQSAFDSAGLGWGYTSPCKKDHRYWLPDTPWVRIDHILCSAEWEIGSCIVGEKDGSDHRLIAATLRLVQPMSGESLPERGEPHEGEITADETAAAVNAGN